MIATGTLTCQVTPDSVEPGTLSCGIPPLEWLDLWTILGAWATVFATLLLAFFAWKAWTTSQSQLEEARRATSVTIGEQETGRQIEAHSSYIGAFTDMLEDRVNPFVGSPNAMATVGVVQQRNAAVLRDIETTGMTWRLNHFNNKRDMEIFEELESSVILAKGHPKVPRSTWAPAARRLRDLTVRWQSEPNRRSELTREISQVTAQLWVDAREPGLERSEYLKRPGSQ